MWHRSDLAIAGSLAALLPPSWLLPERSWTSLCRALARMPLLIDRAALDRTAGIIQAATREPDRQCAEVTARDLLAAVYELHMKNWRAWRPGGWHPKIALDGEHHLVRALARGKGAILWVAHFAFNSNITKIASWKRGARRRCAEATAILRRLPYIPSPQDIARYRRIRRSFGPMVARLVLRVFPATRSIEQRARSEV
jgi:hypothetical protein